MTRAYYNEIEPFAAEWLRNLIAAGLVADGDVDERDIRDVRPSDLAGYTQCHFFAGIGAWSYALRLAGWPDDRPVWTGSCPCQPFSAAGRRNGFDDERHLWPAWHHLIWHARPPIIFGEQVAGKDSWTWFDLVHTDMEGTGYACGAAVLPAASVGAPHIRHRLWFAADIERGMGHASAPRLPHPEPDGVARTWRGQEGRAAKQPGRAFWSGARWHLCRDSRYRAIEPGVFPLAYGAAERVGRLRAYGNTIVPWVAAEFIAAYLEARGEDALTLMDMLE